MRDIVQSEYVVSIGLQDIHLISTGVPFSRTVMTYFCCPKTSKQKKVRYKSNGLLIQVDLHLGMFNAKNATFNCCVTAVLTLYCLLSTR